MEISWFGPQISQIGKIPGYFADFLGFASDFGFCPRPALRLGETRELPEWSTKHPLVSLEISGNAKTKVLGTLSFPFSAYVALTNIPP